MSGKTLFSNVVLELFFITFINVLIIFNFILYLGSSCTILSLSTIELSSEAHTLTPD